MRRRAWKFLGWLVAYVAAAHIGLALVLIAVWLVSTVEGWLGALIERIGL